MEHNHSPQAPDASVSWYQAGQNAKIVTPGDLIVVDRGGVQSQIIRFGQWLRTPKADKRYCWASHVGIVAHDRQVIEAESGGVRQDGLDKYQHRLYAIISPHVAASQREEALRYAEWALGLGYGWYEFPGIVFSILTGVHLATGTDQRIICSQLAAEAHKRLGLIPDKLVALPSDIARYYNAYPETT